MTFKSCLKFSDNSRISRRSLGAKSQKMHQTRLGLPHQVANVSWFYLMDTPIETIIWLSVQLFRWAKTY